MLQIFTMRSDLIAEFARLLGSRGVRAPHDFETAVAGAVVEPASLDELGEVMRKCERDRMTLAPLGACRTLRYLRAAPVEAGISLAAMAPVLSHEPDDMTVVAGAGMTLGALDATLAAHGQHLPVDPPQPERTTIGALLGAAQSGPLRLSAGTVRDFLIGVQFAGHGGRAARGGGRVVKNVAGYDLMKLMIGSFGTLGIITEATFKVRPLPEVYAVALSYHAGLDDAFNAGFRLHDALPLLHLEVLSPGARAPIARVGHYMLAAGVGGNRMDVDYQLEEIRKAVPGVSVAEADDAMAVYRAVRDAQLPDTAVRMQLSVLPRELPSCLGGTGLHFRAHAASGVAQVAFDGGPDRSDAAAIAAALRQAATAGRGHARVLALDPALRGAIEFFDQPGAGALKLMRGLKAAFDPAGVFNPGCFVGGL
jgi:glycolate oxidase FAD binding subunit